MRYVKRTAKKPYSWTQKRVDKTTQELNPDRLMNDFQQAQERAYSGSK